MRFLVLSLMGFGFSADAAIYNMQCDLLSTIYKAEITVPNVGFVAADPKTDYMGSITDPKDNRYVVGFVRVSGRFLLTQKVTVDYLQHDAQSRRLRIAFPVRSL